MRALLFSFVALCSMGCESGVSLTIDLRTDYVPGAEILRAEVVAEGASGEQRWDDLQAPPIERSLRLASLTGLSPARGRAVDVRLYGPGDALVAETRAVVDNRADRVHTIVVERGCAGVACGEGERCVGGRCQDARCLTGVEEDCEAGCGADAECGPPRADCASARCVDRVCFAAGDGCADGFYCDPSAGCREAPSRCDGGACGEGPWVAVARSDEQCQVYGLATSEGGPVIATGQHGSLTVDDAPLEGATGEQVLLLAFDAEGALRWHTRVDSTHYSSPRDLTAGPDGAVVVTGALSGISTFGGPSYDTGARQEPVTALVAADGTPDVPLFFAGDRANAQGRGVETRDGRTAIAGLYGANLAVHDVTLPPASLDDGFVALVEGGAARFAYPVSGGSNTAMNAAALGPDRACFGGRVSGTVTYEGGGSLIPAGRTAALVVCYDLEGVHLWHQVILGDAGSRVVDVELTEDGALAVVGFSSGVVRLGDEERPGAGMEDAFVALFDPAGALVWLEVIGSAVDDRVARLALSGRGTLGVGGGVVGDGTLLGETVTEGGWFAELDLADGAPVSALRHFPGRFDVNAVAWDEARGRFFVAGTGRGEVTFFAAPVDLGAVGAAVFAIP